MKYSVKPHKDTFSSFTGIVLIFVLVLLTIIVDNLNILPTN
jgi:hypothetical protein